MSTACWRWLAAACGGLTLVAAQAQDEPPPDLDFLEYLGAWDESDDEWIAVSEWEDDGRPAPERPRGADTDRNDEAEDED